MHYLYFICERKFYARKNYATLEINPKVKLQVVAHLSSGIVERAKRERACKLPHAKKDDTPLLSPHRVSLHSRGVIFTSACVSAAVLSLRKNGGLLVVYP